MAGFGERVQRRWLVNVEFEQSLNGGQSSTKLLLVIHPSLYPSLYAGTCAAVARHLIRNALGTVSCALVRVDQGRDYAPGGEQCKY